MANNLTIYKYPLLLQDCQWIEMPFGAEPISAQEQYGQVVLYAIVSPNAPNATMMVFLRGTGQPLEPLPPNAKFIDTVQINGGQLVWHVFAAPYSG